MVQILIIGSREFQKCKHRVLWFSKNILGSVMNQRLTFGKINVFGLKNTSNGADDSCGSHNLKKKEKEKEKMDAHLCPSHRRCFHLFSHCLGTSSQKVYFSLGSFCGYAQNTFLSKLCLKRR